MAAIANEFRSFLRQFDYPKCAAEALPRIEAMLAARNKTPLAMQIISEFIFLETPRDIDMRLPPPPMAQMTLIREFELLIVLIEYFAQPMPGHATRNTVFFALFGCNLSMQRKRVLCRLISTAITESVLPVLDASGNWFEQAGPITGDSMDIAQGIVHDFITFTSKTPEQLRNMPMLSPIFALNFMAIVADIYLNDTVHKNVLVPPPEPLVTIFNEWVNEDPSICYAKPSPLSLVPVFKSLPSLLRWSVLSPLVSSALVFSDLHMAVLNAIDQLPKAGLPPSIPVAEFIRIAFALQKYAASSWYAADTDVALPKAMERFAQALLTVLHAKCMMGNICALIRLIKALPSHPLMEILLKTDYVQPKPLPTVCEVQPQSEL